MTDENMFRAMPWGIGKRESEETFDKRMKARDVWMNEMWKAYRVNLSKQRDGFYLSKEEWTYPETCPGTGKDPRWPRGAMHNGQGFDHFKWKGDSYGTEKGYCADCGEQLARGVGFSPWKDAAYEAWLRTRYMTQTHRDRFLDRTAQSIKFAQRGKRKIVTMSDGDKTYDVVVHNRGYSDDYGNPMWFGK